MLGYIEHDVVLELTGGKVRYVGSWSDGICILSTPFPFLLALTMVFLRKGTHAFV
jgi:hypothetical protein